MPTGMFFLWKRTKKQREIDKKFFISSLFQSSSGPDKIPFSFLEQMLDICVDKPINLYAFDLVAARDSLSRYPFFETMEVKKVKPSALYIDYTLRRPFALLANFENTAIDQEGVLFPKFPFFSPKNLPKVLLDEDFFSDTVWGKKIPEKRMELLLDILDHFDKMENVLIESVDLSKINAPSYGQREIVVILYDRVKTFLRLSVNHYKEKLTHYSLIREQKLDLLKDQPVILDLRMPEVAHIIFFS